jgi:hypothetical protein
MLAAQAAAAPSSVHPETDALTKIFVEACVYGEVRLTPAMGRPIAEAEVPLWRRVRGGRSHYFELSQGKEALLRVTDFDKPRKSDGVTRICSVLTDGHDLAAAWRKVATSVSGDLNPKVQRHVDHYEIHYPGRGYNLLLTTSWMSTFIFDPATAARLVAEQPKSVKGKPVVTARDTIF